MLIKYIIRRKKQNAYNTNHGKKNTIYKYDRIIMGC